MSETNEPVMPKVPVETMQQLMGATDESKMTDDELADKIAAEVKASEGTVKTMELQDVPVEVDPDVPQGPGLLEVMVDYLKRFNGYPYVSASRILTIPEDQKQWSYLLQGLFINYLQKGHAKIEDFKKMFLNEHICYIQVHKECPTMAKDGAYSSYNVEGKFFKTVLIGAFDIQNVATFQNTIILRTGPGKVGEPGTLGMIIGDPYHQVTPEEAAAVIRETQPQAVLTQEEIASSQAELANDAVETK